MTSWLPDPTLLRRPRYIGLVSQVAQAIRAGQLRPGERLPTHRALADVLGLSVQTVSRAYNELIRRDLITGEVGRGTFVRAGRSDPPTPFIPDTRRGEIIDLSLQKPVGGDIHLTRMAQALHGLAEDLPPQILFSFRPNIALQPHREAAVAWLQRCGVDSRPDSIQITNGTTPAMTVALMTVARPGELIVTEAVGYHTLTPLANYLGFRLKGIAVDREGMMPGPLAEACASGLVRAIVIMPSAMTPMVTMMSTERRERIAAIARRHDIFLIENDACGPLIADRPPPIAAFAPERTFYVTSFTKCLMPGLRTGYLVVPDIMIPAFANRHLVTNWMATAMTAEIARRWVLDGTAWELLVWQREALAARHQAAGEILGDFDLRHVPHSLHIWMALPETWSEDEFVTHARLQGVAVAPGSSFVIDPEAQTRALRLCIGSPPANRLIEGLETIGRLLRGLPEPALLAI